MNFVLIKDVNQGCELIIITLKLIDVTVHVISLVCWSQTIRANPRLLAQISSTFITRGNDWIP